jgi:hypothetical protein
LMCFQKREPVLKQLMQVTWRREDILVTK